MEIIPTEIEGAFIVQSKISTDQRGWFLKTFHNDIFGEYGIKFFAQEIFFSLSKKCVIRGLHFQAPPKTSSKLVTCLTGCVLDVIFDMRKLSPSYGRVFSCELNLNDGRSLFIPPGVAHGFYVLDGPAVMAYGVSAPYDQQLDSGIRWDSINFDWPLTEKPTLSQRDQCLPSWENYDNPF
jgi:dTDP-4-dehydrorhamnose 3,5-epimerase